MSCLYKTGILLIVSALLFTSCGETRDNQASDAGDAYNATASENYTDAEVRAIMEEVWAPIQQFYEAAGVGNPSKRPLPDELDTPDEVQRSLEKTMTPELASGFTEQLIWERNGTYKVRPTERIRTIQHVDTDLIIQEKNENKLVVAEQYPPSELYGSQPRVNILEQQDGQWKLVDLR